MMNKRIFSKTLSIIIAAAMLLALLPTGMIASAEIVDSGTCGDNLTWTLDDAGNLTISGTGDMWDYDFSDSFPTPTSPWVGSRGSIKTVTINNGVTSIGKCAFAFHYPSSVTMADTVTSIGAAAFEWGGFDSINFSSNLESIGGAAFSSCNIKMDTLVLPNGLKYIGNGAFYFCDYILKNVYIPDSVTYIGDYGFYPSSNGFTLHVFKNSYAHLWAQNNASSCSFSFEVMEKSGKCGDNLYWNLDGTVLTIMGTGDMYEDLAIAWPSFITEANIGSGATSIGGGAFEGCTDLTSVTIPDSVTSISSWAFCGCTSLTSVTIPDSVTSIGGAAFTECSNLESVNIPNGLTSIASSLFEGCTSLTSITIPDSVKIIENYAFCNCSSLESVTIPGSVETIEGEAFRECDIMTSIVLGEGISTIGHGAFRGCTSLKAIAIPASVTSIGSWVLTGCDYLESITVDDNNEFYHSSGDCLIETGTKVLVAGCQNSVIPDDGSVTSIGEAAFNIYWLNSIVIPDSVTSIGYLAFSRSGLMSITLGSGVTSIGDYAFSDCPNLTSITVDPNNPVLHSEGNCVINTHEKKIIAGCRASVIPADGSVTAIAQNAFHGAKGMEYIVVPKSVTNIESKYAFQGTSNYDDHGYATLYVYKNSYAHLWAQSNDIPFELITDQSGKCGDNLYWSTEDQTLNIVGTGDMYDYAYWASSNNKSPFPKHINEVNISDGVTSIGSSAFYDCTCFTSVTMPDSVTSIGWGAFYGCTGLASVTIGNCVTSIGGSAFYNTGYYNNNANWENGLLYIGNWLIETKKDISGAYTIRNGTMGIAGDAFRECTGLTSVTILDSVTSIGNRAFDGCTGLTSVIIPNSITSIGFEAFFDCTSLTSVTIPASVTSIGDWTFYYYDVNGDDADKPMDITLRVYENSYAHQYAIDNGLKYELIKEPEYKKGDADGDGKITVSDALAALRIAARLVVPTADDYAVLDIDGDGVIAVNDALAILRVAARLVDSL